MYFYKALEGMLILYWNSPPVNAYNNNKKCDSTQLLHIPAHLRAWKFQVQNLFFLILVFFLSGLRIVFFSFSINACSLGCTLVKNLRTSSTVTVWLSCCKNIPFQQEAHNQAAFQCFFVYSFCNLRAAANLSFVQGLDAKYKRCCCSIRQSCATRH